MKKPVRTIKDILPFFAQAGAIEEVCGGRYIDTHTIINTPEDGERTGFVTLHGSERHAETSTEIALEEEFTIHDQGREIRTKDTNGNLISLKFFKLVPLRIK